MSTLEIVRRFQRRALERRLHHREFADGSVLIKTQDNVLRTAELVDRSVGGLRIRFSGEALTPGFHLRVMTPFSDLHARVAWSRATETGAEAGLQVWPVDNRTN
jgi:hypothetical protein